MKRFLRLEWLAAAAGLGLLAYLLFIAPFAGVADNGDFLRVMLTGGLDYGVPDEAYEDRFFGFAHQFFAYDHFFRGFYFSTQIILVAVARLLGYLFNSSMFDIRVLSAFYSLLLLAATYLLVRHNKYKSLITGAVLGLALLFVFFDIGYTAYFNSLFGEPVSLVFLLLTLAFGLRLVNEEKPSRAVLWLYFISVLFLTCSKIQNAPVGILFAAIGLQFAGLQTQFSWRRLVFWLSGAMVVISVVMYIAAPKDFKDINLYQTVFFGILKDSPDVKGDLKALGLPEHLSVLADTNYFQSGTAIKQDDPSLRGDFYDRVSHSDVLFFYLKHPGRLIDKMEYAANNSMSIRPYYLGTYLKESGKPAGSLAMGYSGWSQFKNQHMPNSLLFIALFYLAYYSVGLVEYVRSSQKAVRLRIQLLMAVGLVGMVGFMVPILGDGLADLGKHLFLFNVCFDMMIIASAVWLAHLIYRFASGKSRL